MAKMTKEMERYLSEADDSATEVDKTIEILESMLIQIPNPSQEDIRKLVAAQGVALNNFAVHLMGTLKGRERIDGRVRLILKVFEVSRAALSDAARIKD